MHRFAIVFLNATVIAVFAAGCGESGLGISGSDGGGPGNTPTPDLAQPAPDLTQEPDLLVTASGIGDSCTGNGGQDQGSCNAGQACIPDPQFGFTDGYCTAQCSANTPCPPDASCVMVGGQFSICFLNCTADTDCRQPNYSCQTRGSHKVCLPVNMGGGGNNGGVPPGTGPNGAACVMPVVNPGGIKGGIFGPNTQISGAGKSIEAEVELAVDPTNKNIVVAWNALTNNAGAFGLVASNDDGNSWGKETFLPMNKMVDVNQEQSDPVVAINNKGEFLVSWVGFDRSQQNPNPSNMHIFVARSMNGGITWSEIYQVSPNNEWQNGGFLDKPWIYASPVDNTVYLTWDRQANQNSGVDIRMARSTDGGKTWSAPVSINDPNKRNTADRNLAQIAIGQNGLPVVAWVEIGNVQFGSTQNQVYVQRFNQDGTKNGGNVLVTHPPDSPAFEDPSITVSGNNVYVGFVSGTPKGVWDIQVAASLDGGAT